MTTRALLTVVLAAGKGTRMKSSLPKVLHPIAGQSMLGHVLASTRIAGCDRVAVVVGPDMEQVRAEATRVRPDAQVFVQSAQRGTADALLAAREAIAAHHGDVIMLFGDTPLVRPETIGRLAGALAGGAHVAVLGFEAADPTGYGRLIMSGPELMAIREHKDCSADERRIRLCNGGAMAFRGEGLLELLAQIAPNNAQGELYLTDVVAIARAAGHSVTAITSPEEEILGINSRDQLAEAEAIWQRRTRLHWMREGVTMIAPETVYFAHDTRLGRDVTIEPNVFFGPGVTIADEVEIKSNCHIEGASVGRNARVGPFARLRPGADLGTDVHVGNFVEVKNVTMSAGSKANHLAYLGDGSVGAKANIGAGTIFCNYDGYFKHRTEIGAGAFIGSNSALVAPIRIGNGAFVGSGSVITKDVADDALALERAKQDVRPGWAAKFRTMMARKKAAKTGRDLGKTA